jgi:hypothetical protein
MLPVSSAELAQIQSDAVAAACDKTCVIKRKTVAKDAYGSETETWNTIATTVAGMSEPTAGQLTNYAYLIGDLATWQVKLPVGTDVKAQDHLVIAGQTITVQIDLTPRSYASLITVLASEVKQGA